MKNLIHKKYTIWIIAGFFWAFFMYVSHYGFTLNTRWEFIVLYLAGGFLWGLITGFFFNFSYQRKSYDTDKYKEIMMKRLKSGKKLNKNLREYNLFNQTRNLDTIKELWDVMIEKVIQIESDGVVFVEQENWHEIIYQKLNKVIEERQLTVKEFGELSAIISKFNEFDRNQLQKFGIIQFYQLLARMEDIIENFVLVTIDDVNEFEVLFLYYYYALKLGIVELDEFNEFLNVETLKDNVDDVIIDLQFVSNRGVNEIIEVMYKYLEEEKRVLKKYLLIFIARGVSYQAIKLYKEKKKTEDEFLDIMYSMYGYFRFIPELHVFDHYEYYPEFDGFEQGLKCQEEYSINIMEFFRVG
ncbi:MAG: hypothetical protein AB7E61_00450 [Acholeplasmataceae bacterium]